MADINLSERWRQIAGYEGRYEVSSFGNVRSLLTNKSLKPGRTKGYCFVSLRRNGLTTQRYVHHLVLEAFVGPRPPGMEACHDPDPDRGNNSVTNLRWDTRLANIADTVRRGANYRHPPGTVTNSSLTPDSAQHAVALFRSGVSRKEIAARLGVGKSCIKLLLQGRSWSHVTGIPRPRLT